MSDEETFEQVDAGAADCYPVRAGEVKKGSFVVIKGHPCKVVDYSTSKTGKHGHAKAKIVAIDIFTGKKLEDVCPTGHNLYAPNVTRTEYQLIDVTEDGFATLMDPTSGETKDSLKLPPDSALEDPEEMKRYTALLESMRSGEKDVYVVVLTALGQEMILSQAREA